MKFDLKTGCTSSPCMTFYIRDRRRIQRLMNGGWMSVNLVHATRLIKGHIHIMAEYCLLVLFFIIFFHTGRLCESRVQVCHLRPCLNGATCLDSAFGFVCFCRPGFSGYQCETVLATQGGSDIMPLHNLGQPLPVSYIQQGGNQIVGTMTCCLHTFNRLLRGENGFCDET